MEKDSDNFEDLLRGFEHEEIVETNENFEYDYELDMIMR
jgi:hypothetical protein